MIYEYALTGGLALTVAWFKYVSYTQQDATANAATPAFKTFQFNYILIFLLVMMADWMQGPYVYALYQEYGYNQSEIGKLFVAGFGTAGLAGFVIGGIADRFGRRLMCFVFCISYILSCVTKHYAAYQILMVGRFLGGLATAILFSCFESWMVTHHHKHGFDGSLIGDTFQKAYGYNAIVAVLAGFISSYGVNFYRSQMSSDAPGGTPAEVAAFDISMVFLGIAFLLLFRWEENYGDVNVDMRGTMSKAIQLMKTDRRVLLLGTMQSLFESAMYIFVFLWTPALSESYTNIDHGWVFADFMLACMIGTEIFGRVMKQNLIPAETFIMLSFFFAALCIGVASFVKNYSLRLVMFLGFEMSVGCYWPCVGSLRSRIIPDEVRATVMNVFRIPLNVLVVGILWEIDLLSIRQTFMVCFTFLFVSGVCANMLSRYPKSGTQGKDTPGNTEERDELLGDTPGNGEL